MRILSIILTISVLFCACSTNTKMEEPVQPEEPRENPVNITYNPILLSKEMHNLLGPGTDFAFRFFKQASQEYADKNLFLSPYSLACVLGMLYNGAEGETKEEIAAVLGMSDSSPEQVNEYYRTLTKGLLAADSHTDLGIANAVWSHTPFPVKKSFAGLVKTYYDAEVSTMDFALPASLKAMNDWASEKTKRTIPKIFEKPDELHPPVVLTNAVYFKSAWTVPFKTFKTEPKPFHNHNGSVSTVQMMHQEELLLNYAHTSNYELVRLPYANGAFAMNIVLPKEGAGLEEVVESIDGAVWETLTKEMVVSPVHVTLSMPRFTLEDNHYELAGTLKAIGMIRSFSEDAELTAMLDVPAFLGRIFQKSYIDVGEEGTEASAVTVITMIGLSGDPLPPPAHTIMVVDRPFIFAITEQSTGAILFMGKITKL